VEPKPSSISKVNNKIDERNKKRELVEQKSGMEEKAGLK
jgi:hypothetical protein